jgi:hypothetical protein
MYDPAHARSRTVQPIGGNLKPDLTLKICLVYNKTGIKRNILTIKQNTPGSRLG